MTARRQWRGHLHRLLVLAVLGAMLILLWRSRSELSGMIEHASPWLLGGAMLWLVALFFLGAAGWVLILRYVCGLSVSLSFGGWVWMQSSAARYLPGGVWSYVTRVGVMTKAGFPGWLVGGSLVHEMVLLSLSALTVGLPCLGQYLGGSGFLYPAVAGVVLGLAALHPRVLALGHRLPGRLGEACRVMSGAKFSSVSLIYFYYIGYWVLFGIGVWGFAGALGVEVGLERIVPAFAFSFFVGFVAVFAPGGIGVREGVLFALVEPDLGASAALLLAAGSRGWLMIGEILSFGVFYLAHRILASRQV